MTPTPDPPIVPTSPDPTGSSAERHDFAAELAKAAPRKWWNRGTLVLGAVALVLGGFLGGLQVQKHHGTETTGRAGSAGSRAGFPGGGTYGGGVPAGGAGAAVAAPTTGRVKLVNGTTIYVETADGTVITVRTSGDTTVQSATEGRLKDVKAGDTVSVQGAADTEGTVTATTVTERKD